jgi:group I intron endonuclease
MSEELEIRLQGVELTEQASFAPASCGIYGIFNFIDNAFYVGSSLSVRRRLKDHLSKLRNTKHRNRDLQTRWGNTEESNWCFVLFELCTPEERFVKEQWFIDVRLSHFEGYNLSGKAGHPATYQWTPEQRERHSKAQLRRLQEQPLTIVEKRRLQTLNLGRKLPQEEKDRISQKLEGRTFSPETIRRMSEGHRRQFALNPVSLKTRQKMSESGKKKIFTEEHKKNIGGGQQKRWARERAAHV